VSGFQLVDFTYNGVVYDRLAVNANGWICLGSSTLTPSVNTGGSSYTPLSSTTAITPAALAAKIAGFALDLQGQTNSSIRIETIGTAPNRVCVVQWKGYRAYNATGNNFNFQIRLLETTNTVEVAFGVMGAGTGSYFGMLGLRAEPAATATNFLSLSSTTSWVAPVLITSASGTMTLTSSNYPDSGSFYRFSTPSGTDLQAMSIEAPVPPLTGSTPAPVTLRIRNTGFAPITSATLGYQMTGGSLVSESWTGNLTTGQTADHTFTTGLTTPASGSFSVTSHVSNINGLGPDANQANDTITRNYILAMSGGTYVIGSSATANFPTVTSAVNAMRQGGITGSINFLIEPGTYFSPTGGYDLTSIVGAGGSTTIGFSSLTGSAATSFCTTTPRELLPVLVTPLIFRSPAFPLAL